MVQRQEQSALVNGTGRGDRVLEGLAGDESAREAGRVAHPDTRRDALEREAAGEEVKECFETLASIQLTVSSEPLAAPLSGRKIAVYTGDGLLPGSTATRRRPALVPWNRDGLPKSRSAAPGGQGAKSELTGRK